MFPETTHKDVTNHYDMVVTKTDPGKNVFKPEFFTEQFWSGLSSSSA